MRVYHLGGVMTEGILSDFKNVTHKNGDFDVI